MTCVEVIRGRGVYTRVSLRGRPPHLPLLPEVALFAGDVALPPALPSKPAIQRRVPNNPCSSDGK